MAGRPNFLQSTLELIFQMKDQHLTKIIVTGASGFIGRNIIEYLCEDYYIYAFARRTQQEVGVVAHENIEWILTDIAHESSLAETIENIKQNGGIDFVIHLAAYYDYDNEPHPEFERTNVVGTRLLLEHCKTLNIKRFVFASSIAACNFPPAGETVNEKSPLDADFPYAISKKKGEQMLKEHSESFACTSIRLAAVYSDWCEYGPLYLLLKTWLSSSWRSRIIGGKGETAIPYLHVNCLAKMIALVLEKSEQLPKFDIYIAGPGGSTPHLELFNKATRLYFGKIIPPAFMSKWMVTIGIYVLDALGRLIGERPLERPWMIKYIDLKLNIETSYTRKTLGWEPGPRYHIDRRLLFLIEHLKSSPDRWHRKNTAALAKPSLERPNLILAEMMQHMQEEITHRILAHLLSPDHKDIFKHYQDLNDPTEVKWYLEAVYNLLIVSVRHGDRYQLVNYARSLAKIRSKEGFESAEVCQALTAVGKYISLALLALPETANMELFIHDWITLSIQMAVDEVEASFEKIARLKARAIPNVCD